MKKVLIVLLCCVFLFSFNSVIAYQEQAQLGACETEAEITYLDLGESNQGGRRDNQQQGQENTGQSLDQGLQAGEPSASRVNRISNTRQFMLEIAERNQGISQQIRNITQNQAQIQEEAENALESARKRNSFVEFLIGPDYRQLKGVEEHLKQHGQNLDQLKVLKENIIDEEDATLFDEQIQVIEGVKQELENELERSRSSFSLFGWMSRLFNL